jgi:L-ascorbate metabolism protein UlaG (beta-lactamase superfamily)
MKLIGELDPIDLMFVPIGDNFTMGVDDAVRAVEFVRPKIAVPIHYKTWEIIDADPNEFARKLQGSGVKVVILNPNQSLEL